MRIHFLSVLFLLFACFSLSAQTITVLDPNGGEQLYGCQTYTIRWNGTNTSGSYSIDFSTDNAQNWTSVASGLFLPGNGTHTFVWTVPKVQSNQCRIRVVDFNASGVRDSSDAVFTISDPVEMVAPNGGEVWTGLSYQVIDWDNRASSNSWDLEFSTDGGNNWVSIINNYASATGNYLWQIPNLQSSHCLVRVTDRINSCITTMSDSVFTINALPMQVTQPNGGETWYQYDRETVLWVDSTVGGYPVRIDYSADSGATWNFITNTNSPGAYPWFVPAIETNRALIRVTNSANPPRSDVSDSVFTITNGIHLLSPNGGDSLEGCITQIAQVWAAPFINTIGLDYSLDGGVTWTNCGFASKGASDTVSVPFNLPNINAGQVLLRARDVVTLAQDEADSTVTIFPGKHLFITSPVAGDSIIRGTVFPITWNADSLISSQVDLYFRPNQSSSWQIIIAGYPTQPGVYNWTVPGFFSRDCEIQIRDANRGCHEDISDPFFIAFPKPVLLVPNGGEVWYVGNVEQIRWDVQTVSGNVELEYSLDSGATWATLVGNAFGAYNWQIPNIPSTRALVRLRERNFSYRIDTSDAVFTIKPRVSLVSHNRPDSVEACIQDTVLVEVGSTSSQNVFIQFSTDHGATWSHLGSGTVQGPGIAGVPVRFPKAAIGDSVRLRAYIAGYGSDDDVSDSSFTVFSRKHIWVTYPGNGDTLYSAVRDTIRWRTDSLTPDRISIRISTNGGNSWSFISSNIPGALGKIAWTPFPRNTDSCLIWLSDTDECLQDTSDPYFSLVTPKPLLTSPNGGEVWYASGTEHITWDITTLAANGSLEYSLDSGQTWTLVTNNIGAFSGSYPWIIPNVRSTQALVRIYEFNNSPERRDTSDAVFTIAAPLQLLYPNGGDSLEGCRWDSIRVFAAGGVNSFRTFYSADGGQTWNYLGLQNVGSPGVYYQPVRWPNVSEQQVLVRVEFGSQYQDTSDAFNTLFPTKNLEVVKPNGGETLYTGDTTYITWTGNSLVSGSRVNINFSSDGGATWTSLGTNIAFSQDSMQWVIPNLRSSNCLIEIEDLYNDCNRDTSDAVFTIDARKPLLLYPNGGEFLYGGDRESIQWDRLTVLGNVKLEFSSDGGTTWTVLYHSYFPQFSAVAWDLPQITTNQALVRLTDLADTTRKDTSDAFFSINRAVTILSPVPGDSLEGCVPDTIWFTHKPQIDELHLAISIDSGNTYNHLQTRRGFAGSSGPDYFIYTPPNGVKSNQVAFRLQNASNSLQSDTTDPGIVLCPGKRLVVNTPNGGEQLLAGSTYTISWTPDAIISNTVDIRFSTNSGSSWTTVVSGHPARPGTYTWNVPLFQAANCLIEVIDRSRDCHRDTSDAVFRIDPANPVLLVPNGGECYFGHDRHRIEWDDSSITGSARLAYSLDSGATWTFINSVNGLAGSLNWNIPTVPQVNHKVLIRVSENGNLNRADSSDAVFTIKPPLEILYPLPGDTVPGCIEDSICVRKGIRAHTVNTYYSTDGGNSWIRNLSFYRLPAFQDSGIVKIPITFPNAHHNQVRIRIERVGSSQQYDIRSDGNFVTEPGKSVILTSPNGGDTLNSGTYFPITWTSNSLAGPTVDLFYKWGPTGQLRYIGNAPTQNGVFNWRVPAMRGSRYELEIIDRNQPCLRDTSDSSFTVIAPKPLLLQPNGGEVYWPNTVDTIKWDKRTLAASAYVEFSADSGQTWTTIGSSVDSTDTPLPWVIPNVATEKALVRIRESSSIPAADTSDAVFTIKPAIRVIAPNGPSGNEDLRGCTVTTIRWVHAPGLSPFNLDYTTDNGSSWNSIATFVSTQNDTGVYNWTMPNGLLSTVKVRVQYAGGSPVFVDESDSAFTITQPVRLLQPAFGGTLQVGTVHPITWISDGISNFYNLEYSTNGGSSWITIVNNFNTSSYTYNWTVPNRLSSNCLVRVTDALNPCKSDVSDRFFVISNASPAITLTAPNGFDTLNGCGSLPITWNASGTSGFYDLEFTTDGGQNWVTIATNFQTTTNTYTWNYPNLNSYTCLVRVRDAANATKIDQSDAAFAILPVGMTVSGDTSICGGSNVQLLASGVDSYSWTPSAGLSSASVGNPIASPAVSTTYTVTGQKGSCSFTDTVRVAVVGRPAVAVSGSLTLCQGDSVTLTAPGTGTIQWSNGASGTSIVVMQGGTYSFSQQLGACTLLSDSVSVSVQNLPVPNISVLGPTTFCQGDSVILATSLGSNIQWSNGANTPSVVVKSSGSYTVSDTRTCGKTSGAVQVTVNARPAVPVIVAGGPLSFCQGDSVVLSVASGAGLNWSTGDTVSSITVKQSGTYVVTATGTGGCDAVAVPVTVTVTPATQLSVASSGATQFCQGDSVVLTSSLAGGNIWSNGDTARSIVVRQAGNYFVGDRLGCGITSSPVSVTVNAQPAAPVVTASGPTTFCQGDSVVLSSSYASGNVWTGGSTASSIVVSGSGTYAATYTDGNGCQATSGPVSVLANPLPATPVITPSGPTTFCAGNSLTLTSSGGAGSVWSNGGNGSSITVTSSGNYAVSITDTNGCSAAAAAIPVTVNAQPAAPVVTASGPTTFCQGDSVVLSSSYAAGNVWTGGGTASSLTVRASGTYLVTHTDSNGCFAVSTPVNVVVNPLPATPVITASGPTSLCAGDSVVLTSSAGAGSVWSNGGNGNSITVSNAGSYTVSITDNNGCAAASAATQVTVNALPTPPVVTPGSATTFCQGGSVLLTSSYSTGNSWSNGGTGGAISVSSSGTYAVTHTDGNGCSAVSAPVVVTVNPLPATPVVSPSGPTTFCAGDSVVLTSSAGGNSVWSNGANGSAVTVSSSGSFSVSITDNNGCSASSAVTQVTVNPLPTVPVIIPSGPSTFCQGDSVVLTSSYSTGNTWTGGSTASTLVVKSSGTYAVTHTDGNGCQASSGTLTVTVNPLPATPVIVPGGPTTFCAGDSVMLTSSAGSGSVWSNGQTGASIIVKASGNFSVAITDSNGCTATASGLGVTVNPLPAKPGVLQVGADLETSNVAGLTYQWLLGGNPIPGATDTVFSPTQSGVFSVRVTDANGCSQTSDPFNYTFAGMSEPAAGDAFQVFPNPNAGFFKIRLRLSKAAAVQVSVRTLHGQEILRRRLQGVSGAQAFELDLGPVSRGVYFLVVEAGKLKWTERLVVQ